MLSTEHIQRLLKPYTPPVQQPSKHWIRPIVEQILDERGEITGPELAKISGVTNESGNRYLRDFRDEGWIAAEPVYKRLKSTRGFTTTTRILVYRRI